MDTTGCRRKEDMCHRLKNTWFDETKTWNEFGAMTWAMPCRNTLNRTLQSEPSDPSTSINSKVNQPWAQGKQQLQSQGRKQSRHVCSCSGGWTPDHPCFSDSALKSQPWPTKGGSKAAFSLNHDKWGYECWRDLHEEWPEQENRDRMQSQSVTRNFNPLDKNTVLAILTV